ncbi:Ltp family lipoprotein [Staphylococcus ureilyticus]|uniref:Ltp family lipoprotein n=1 Tax=Staphylococcus ureilyticus TaxID=94138 RepID=UPI0034DD6B5B
MHKNLKSFNNLNKSGNETKWYERSWIVILALIFVYPIGIALMWGFKKWPFALRLIITALFVIIYFVGFGGDNSSNDKSEDKDLKTELEATKAENKDLKSDIRDLEEKESDTDVATTVEETNEEPSSQEESSSSEEESSSSKEEDTNKPSREEKAALSSAESYSDTMHMSKAGIYDQLTSSAGDEYPDGAAQYAVDNLEANYKENALESAKNYTDIMGMSDDELYDQLTSDAGDKFTEEEAQYAIDHLED